MKRREVFGALAALVVTGCAGEYAQKDYVESSAQCMREYFAWGAASHSPKAQWCSALPFRNQRDTERFIERVKELCDYKLRFRQWNYDEPRPYWVVEVTMNA